MGVFFGEVTLETVKGRASYHDISDEIRENIKKSELKNGCVVISSAHTTCSLYFDECMTQITGEMNICRQILMM